MIDCKFRVDSRLFEKKLKAVGTRLIPFCGKSAELLAKWAFDEIKKRTPETRSGRTDIKALWDMQHTTRGAIETYIIQNLYPNQDILIFFEEGTKPHIIRPVKAKFLHFFIEETGEEVFTKLVRHPGTKKYAMVESVEAELTVKVDAYIQGTFKEVDRLMKMGLT